MCSMNRINCLIIQMISVKCIYRIVVLTLEYMLMITTLTMKIILIYKSNCIYFITKNRSMKWRIAKFSWNCVMIMIWLSQRLKNLMVNITALISVKVITCSEMNQQQITLFLDWLSINAMRHLGCLKIKLVRKKIKLILI